MPKTKKPPPVIKPEFVLEEKKGPQPQRKRKKNAPDKPQPEWMFPPDEDNPVLNPKPKSEARRLQEEKDRDQAIKFLQYKSVTAPLKAPPPDLLLTLVGAFLSSYGFNSTSRIYTTQLQSRKKLDEWKPQLDAKLPKGFPDLVKVFKEWHKEYQERTKMDETSSSSESESEDSEGAKAVKKSKKAKKEARAGAQEAEQAAADINAKDETSSSGGSESSTNDGSESDVEMEDAVPSPRAVKTTKASKKKLPSLSTSSSSSDSDADDEKEPAGAQKPKSTTANVPTAKSLVKSLKRKATSSDTSSSESVSPNIESEAAPLTVAGSSPSKKIKTEATESRSLGTTTSVAKPSSSSDTSSSDSESADEVPKNIAPATSAPISSSSSDTSSSDSESDELDFSKTPKQTLTVTKTTPSKAAKKLDKTSSDSSETLQATSSQKPSTTNTSLTNSNSNSSSDSAAPEETTKRKRSASPMTPAASKQQKKQNTPFQRVPKDTPVDPRMSNAYKSYDYAEKAHQDLSVTKGKGFTKEKNKKKRGSYRGGAIDISGGKGVKFEE
ncbi:hypothetical protein P7C71_g573, partial [Lecanoromycetidae sp. Uapishka_2]